MPGSRAQLGCDSGRSDVGHRGSPRNSVFWSPVEPARTRCRGVSGEHAPPRWQGLSGGGVSDSSAERSGRVGRVGRCPAQAEQDGGSQMRCRRPPVSTSIARSPPFRLGWKAGIRAASVLAVVSTRWASRMISLTSCGPDVTPMFNSGRDSPPGAERVVRAVRPLEQRRSHAGESMEHRSDPRR